MKRPYFTQDTLDRFVERLTDFVGFPVCLLVAFPRIFQDGRSLLDSTRKKWAITIIKMMLNEGSIGFAVEVRLKS